MGVPRAAISRHAARHRKRHAGRAYSALASSRHFGAAKKPSASRREYADFCRAERVRRRSSITSGEHAITPRGLFILMTGIRRAREI